MNKFQAIGRIAAVASAFALAPPAFAAGNDPTPAKRKDAQLYCVKDDITGSRMPRTVCKTRDEWISQYGFDPADQKR